jgi:HEAT repeat protein
MGDIGILTTDRTLVVQSWDDWLATVTSIPADAARGRRLQELAPYIDERRFLARIEETLTTGAVQVLSPAFHRSMFPCPPRTGSGHFTEMQQRVTIGPLLDGRRIAGLLITIQDVTPQLEAERELAAALASEDPDTRRHAADAIVAARRIESLEHFTPVLRNDDWRVRGDAVRGLAAAADRDLLRALLATLQREHRDFSALSSALKLLAVTDVDVTEPLAELLQDPDADLRIQAALALGEQHQPAAAGHLLHALEDPDPNVRFHAIEALGRLRAESAIDPLLSIVEARDFFLTFAALEALGLIHDSRVAPRLVPLLADDDLREAVAHALSQLGDEHVVVPLVAALNRTAEAAPAVAEALAGITDRLIVHGGDDLDVAAAVRETLSSTGRAHLLAAASGARPEAMPAIARVLGWLPGADVLDALTRIVQMPTARAAAVEALVRHGAAAVDPFVSLLTAEDMDLQATAMVALGRLGSRRATAPLVALLDRDPHTVIAASGALARIGEPAAFEPLLGLIGHPDPAVRQAVIGALNSIGHPDMPGRVRRLLQDRDPLARESALRIAGYFGYADAWPLALGCVADPVEAVRVAAIEHLPFFDGDQVLPHLTAALERETPRVRAAAARALARIEGPAPVPLLTGALADSDLWVRYYAARSLGQHLDGEDIPGLATVAETDAAVPVRIAAIDALGARGLRTATAPLLRCAEDPEPEVATAALRALGRLRSPEALDMLRGAGRAVEPERRRAAVDGLGAHANSEAIAQLEWIAAADTDASIADRAVGALAEIAAAGGPAAADAIDSLLELCAVPDRCRAATAGLGGLPGSTIPRVARGLRHADPTVRRRALDVLARFRSPEATRELGTAFGDADAGVRETAAINVMHLGTAAYDDVLIQLRDKDPSKAVRRAAAAVLASRRSAD